MKKHLFSFLILILGMTYFSGLMGMEEEALEPLPIITDMPPRLQVKRREDRGGHPLELLRLAIRNNLSVTGLEHLDCLQEFKKQLKNSKSLVVEVNRGLWKVSSCRFVRDAVPLLDDLIIQLANLNTRVLSLENLADKLDSEFCSSCYFLRKDKLLELFQVKKAKVEEIQLYVQALLANDLEYNNLDEELRNMLRAGLCNSTDPLWQAYNLLTKVLCSMPKLFSKYLSAQKLLRQLKETNGVILVTLEFYQNSLKTIGPNLAKKLSFEQFMEFNRTLDDIHFNLNRELARETNKTPFV